jgi:hypothetical protein
MFNHTEIQGQWPTADRFVLASCDSVYFDQFADRFVKSFHKRLGMPIHLHLINPTQSQIDMCGTWQITHTANHINPQEFRDKVQLCKNKFEHTDEVSERSVLWGFCQAIRFWLVGQYQTKQQTVIVSDIDSAAVQTPSAVQTAELLARTQFSVYNNRIMATFCVFSGKQLALAKAISQWIEQYDQTFTIHNGVDQTALKKCISHPNILPAGWISHIDTKNKKAIEIKVNNNIVFHSKGTRGKTIDLSAYL